MISTSSDASALTCGDPSSLSQTAVGPTSLATDPRSVARDTVVRRRPAEDGQPAVGAQLTGPVGEELLPVGPGLLTLGLTDLTGGARVDETWSGTGASPGTGPGRGRTGPPSTTTNTAPAGAPPVRRSRSARGTHRALRRRQDRTRLEPRLVAHRDPVQAHGAGEVLAPGREQGVRFVVERRCGGGGGLRQQTQQQPGRAQRPAAGHHVQGADLGRGEALRALSSLPGQRLPGLGDQVVQVVRRPLQHPPGCALLRRRQEAA